MTSILFRQIVAAAGAVLVLVLLWFNLSLYPSNSDHYFFPRVAQNLTEQGGSLSDWMMTAAPRYFPDLLIEVISFSLVGSGDAGLALSAGLLVSLQWFAVGLLAWRTGTSWVTALVAGMLYCALCAIFGPHYTSLSYITWHTGTFSIILICLALAIDGNQRPGLLATSAMILLAVLVTASNVLALPIIVSGMGVVTLTYLVQNYRNQSYLNRYRGWLRLALMPGLMGVMACGLGVYLYFQLFPYPVRNPVDTSNLNMGLIKSPRILVEASLATIRSLAQLPVFVIALVTVATSLVLLRRTVAISLLVAVSAFWLITSCINQGLIELGATEEHRYLIMPINGSIAMMALCLSLMAQHFRGLFLVPLLAGVGLVLQWEDVQSSNRDSHDALQAEAACLEHHVLSIDPADLAGTKALVGVSDMFHTNVMPYLTNGVVRLVATKGRSKSVLTWMQEVPLMDHAPIYAVARNQNQAGASDATGPGRVLTVRNAVEQYGTPAEMFECGRLALLHYPDGLLINPPERVVR